jgi:hypothetical protein
MNYQTYKIIVTNDKGKKATKGIMFGNELYSGYGKARKSISSRKSSNQPSSSGQ